MKLYIFLWNVFQFLFGSNFEKKKSIKKFLKPQHLRVLEIGCATGILSTIFQKTNIQYYGLDIDRVAIEFAKKKNLKFKNITFVNSDLKVLLNKLKFDLILIPGILHHCSDDQVKKIFKILIANCKNRSKIDIYIAEPRKVTKNDNYLNRIFMRFFERGKFLRSKKKLNKLISNYIVIKQKHYFKTHKFFSYYSSYHDVIFGKLNCNNK